MTGEVLKYGKNINEKPACTSTEFSMPALGRLVDL
jgi:hypothetical protein